jgi:hypothetical protein
VAHTCNLSYLRGGNKEEEIENITFEGQPKKKLNETPSLSISQVWWHVPVLSAIREAIGRRITIRGWL